MGNYPRKEKALSIFKSKIIVWTTEQFPRRSSHLELFCKKGVLENFTKFIENTCTRVSSFNKVAGQRPATLLKMRPWHRCFPVSFAKFLRTPIFIEHLWWLFLSTSILQKLYMANWIYLKFFQLFLSQ